MGNKLYKDLVKRIVMCEFLFQLFVSSPRILLLLITNTTVWSARLPSRALFLMSVNTCRHNL